MAYIKIFDTQDTQIASNGDITLQPEHADLTVEANGQYACTIEAPLSYINYLTEQRLISVKTPDGWQPYRIRKTETRRTKIISTATHVTHDAQNYLIPDSYVVEKTCLQALEHLNAGVDGTTPFTYLSDITTVDSYRCVRKSLEEALSVIVERWGGQITRNGWTIGVMANPGRDRQLAIRYASNMAGISATYDWGEVCTKILPVGQDGLLLNKLDPNASIFVASETQYTLPYTRSINFEQDIPEDDFKILDTDTGEEVLDENAYTQALIDDLKMQAEAYLVTHSTPQTNYTVEASLIDTVALGDHVIVQDELLGITLDTTVIGYTYDTIAERFTQFQFGTLKPTLQGLSKTLSAKLSENVTDQVSSATSRWDNKLATATDKIWGTLGNSFVQYDGDKILVLDRLPAEEAVNVIAITSGGIGFSNSGIYGNFSTAWSIDGTLDMAQINVLNLVADMINGGTLRLGGENNTSGTLELYDNTNRLIAQMTSGGLQMWADNGGYIIINADNGFVGYDQNGTRIYWVSNQEFHMKKSVIEDEISLCNQLRFIPIQMTQNNQTIEGIGLVSAYRPNNT